MHGNVKVKKLFILNSKIEEIQGFCELMTSCKIIFFLKKECSTTCLLDPISSLLAIDNVTSQQHTHVLYTVM